MTLYPAVVKRLLEQCNEFRAGKLDLYGLKSAIWHATTVITAQEDWAIRHMLMAFEGNLEYCQVMAASDNDLAATLPLLDEIEQYLLQVNGDVG